MPYRFIKKTDSLIQSIVQKYTEEDRVLNSKLDEALFALATAN